MSAVDVHPPIVETLSWDSEDDTRLFAQRLARRLLQQPQLGNAFIALEGELGAGKTTVVRHLLHALGVSGRIKSPTYTVVEPYEVGGNAISHFDFYRFNDQREWEDAGLRDLFAAPGLKLAEWPERVRAALPMEDLNIHIELLDDERRRVTVRAASSIGKVLLR